MHFKCFSSSLGTLGRFKCTVGSSVDSPECTGFSKPNKSFKRQANNTGSTSKRGIDNRVVIHIGFISENVHVEGMLAIARGGKVVLRVGKDFGACEVCKAAV